MSRVASPKIRTIAIIGAGASGAITLSSLIQEEKFDEIVLFERRNITGGVWVLDKTPDELIVPPGEINLDPPLEIPDFEKEYRGRRPQQQRFEKTASYEGLKTNVPEQLMTYSDLKRWGAEGDERVDDLFVRGNVIQRYVETYLNRHKDHTVFRTTVESVTKDYTREDSQFELVLRTETDEVDQDGNPIDLWTKQSFDAVIIATGHYHIPKIPEVPGIQQVYYKFPGLIQHSKTFRHTDSFKDETIIVIGSRASGADIVTLGSQTARQIIQSKRGPSIDKTPEQPNVVFKPIISSYTIEGHDVVVHFTDGSTVTNPDKIIYATGFRYSYPFLKRSYPGFVTASGNLVPELYQHTFYNKDPTLAVVGVPTDAISFRAFEYQAILISRFFAQRVSLPPLKEQIRWSLNRYREKGDSRQYHTIDWGKKLDYLNLLKELGGGDSIGTGRPFPEFSSEDEALLESLAKKFAAFFDVKEG
jgi:cation diffusion facilitator CzcD-associated flavoprotein CzcO